MDTTIYTIDQPNQSEVLLYIYDKEIVKFQSQVNSSEILCSNSNSHFSVLYCITEKL